MYLEGSDVNKHQVAKYGPLTQFGYKDFIPMFTAAKYDPAAWATLFKNAGAKYVVPVFEHHDGFQMYNSDLSDWTAVKMGPHRDLWGDLAKEVRANGMHLGASSHRIEHDWFLEGGRKQPSRPSTIRSTPRSTVPPRLAFKTSLPPATTTSSTIGPTSARSTPKTGLPVPQRSSRSITPT